LEQQAGVVGERVVHHGAWRHWVGARLLLRKLVGLM
jgi:hypothetical protein